MADFSDLITSRVRVKIVKLFYSDTTEMYHVRGVTRLIKEEINAVRRELENLGNAGVLKKEPRGNRVYYWASSQYPYFADLISMAAKSTGLGADIIESKNKIGKVNFVMFSGKFARRKERKREENSGRRLLDTIKGPWWRPSCSGS